MSGLGISGTSAEYDYAFRMARNSVEGGHTLTAMEKEDLVRVVAHNLGMRFDSLRSKVAHVIAETAVRDALLHNKGLKHG